MSTFITAGGIVLVVIIAIAAVMWGENQNQITDVMSSRNHLWITNRSRQWPAFVKDVSLRAIDGTTLGIVIESPTIKPGESRPLSKHEHELHKLLGTDKGWRKLISRTIGWPCVITVKLNLDEKVRRLVCL